MDATVVVATATVVDATAVVVAAIVVVTIEIWEVTTGYVKADSVASFEKIAGWVDLYRVFVSFVRLY